VFFFEKKNQKTFALSPGQLIGHDRPHAATVNGQESFGSRNGKWV
jgi:hypothetical protein